MTLTDAQRSELDNRIDEMDRATSLGVPFQEVLRQIRKKK